MGRRLSRTRRGVVAAACVAALGAALLAPASSLAAPPYDPAPQGANDFGCKPSETHPRPIVLVHGLGATMSENWNYMSPLIKQRGYCVFALTYGTDSRFPWFGGVVPIEQSAPELGEFVDRVLAATGAEKVDLVGHSEGTFMPQYWLKFGGGAAKVDKYVAMTPLYDGTKVAGADTLRDSGEELGLAEPIVDLVTQFCGSCPEFLAGSDMVKKLSEGGAAVPGVTYTTIMSRYDELVVPYTSGFLDDPEATNIVVQDVCPNDISEHGMAAFDPVVARLVLNALDPANRRPVSCDGLPPLAAAPTD